MFCVCRKVCRNSIRLRPLLHVGYLIDKVEGLAKIEQRLADSTDPLSEERVEFSKLAAT
jgi:hypothetical protein